MRNKLKREEIIKRFVATVFLIFLFFSVISSVILVIAIHFQSVLGAFFGGCFSGGLAFGLFIWYWIEEVKEE